MGRHGHEVGADLVDLLQMSRPLPLELLPAPRLLQLGCPLDRRADRPVEAVAQVAHQQAGDQSHEEEEKDPADDEARRRGEAGEAGGPAHDDIEDGDDDGGGQRSGKAQANRAGHDQEVEEQGEVRRSAVAAGEIEDGGGDHQVDARSQEAEPAVGTEAPQQQERDGYVDQRPAGQRQVHRQHGGRRIPVAEVVEDDGRGQHHPAADDRDPLGAGQDGFPAVQGWGGGLGPVRPCGFHPCITESRAPALSSPGDGRPGARPPS